MIAGFEFTVVEVSKIKFNHGDGDVRTKPILLSSTDDAVNMVLKKQRTNRITLIIRHAVRFADVQPCAYIFPT